MEERVNGEAGAMEWAAVNATRRLRKQAKIGLLIYPLSERN